MIFIGGEELHKGLMEMIDMIKLNGKMFCFVLNKLSQPKVIENITFEDNGHGLINSSDPIEENDLIDNCGAVEENGTIGNS